MSEALTRAISTVTRERPQFRDAHDAVRHLVLEHGEAGLADFVLNNSAEAVPSTVLADVLGISFWCTDSNGSVVQRDFERWLSDGSDPRRVEVALYSECYPFRDRDQMTEVLQELSKKMPSVSARCSEIISQRARSSE